MRALILTLFLLQAFTSNLIAQESAIELVKMNVVYLGLPNPINIAGKDLTAKNLVVKSDEACSVVMDGTKGEIHPIEGNRKCVVYIGRKVKKDTVWIDTFEYRIKRVPPIKVQLGSLSSGAASNGAILVQRDIYTFFPNLPYSGVIIKPTHAQVTIFFTDTILGYDISYIDTLIQTEAEDPYIYKDSNRNYCTRGYELIRYTYPQHYNGLMIPWPRDKMTKDTNGYLVMIRVLKIESNLKYDLKGNIIKVQKSPYQLLKTPHFYKIENQTTDNIGSSPLKLIDNFDSRKKGNYQFYNLNKEFMFEQQF